MNARSIKSALHVPTMLTLLISLFSSCCGTREIRIYDEEGRPIQGALVFASMERFPYFGSMCGSLTVTDEIGRARYEKKGRVTVVCDGYWSYSNGGVAPREWRDRSWEDHGGRLTLHRRVRSEPADDLIRVERLDGTQLCPTEPYSDLPCVDVLGVEVFYSLQEGSLLARSSDGGLLRSTRFYFDGPSTDVAVPQLEGHGSLAFYVIDEAGSPKHKVYVEIARGFPAGRSALIVDPNLLVMTRPVKSLDARIEPARDAADHPDSERLGVPVGLSKGNLFLSNNRAELVRVVRSEVTRFKGQEHAAACVEALRTHF